MLPKGRPRKVAPSLHLYCGGAVHSVVLLLIQLRIIGLKPCYSLANGCLFVEKESHKSSKTTFLVLQICQPKSSKFCKRGLIAALEFSLV